MQLNIDTLNRDVTIHKDVEKELAKRSHFCQKVIKRLKEEVKELESKVDGKDTLMSHINIKHGLRTPRNQTVKHLNSAGSTARTSFDNKKLALQDELKSSEELNNFLESKLELHERNLVQKKAEYSALQNEFYSLQDKFNLSRDKYKRAAFILSDFLEDMIRKQPNIL